MIDRFAQFPRSLAERSRTARFGDVPVLLAHPDWVTPAPTILWMHGRTAHKELDPGRYLRWIRAGIAACAIDLPGHGERPEEGAHSGQETPRILARMIAEIDGVVNGLQHPQWNGVFDGTRLGIGGMSAGGMAALRRLCDPHPFVCAAVEGTTGWLAGLYFPKDAVGKWPHDRSLVRTVDASEHLGGFRPIPLLLVHSEADELIPFSVVTGFVQRLRDHYAAAGARPEAVRLESWPTTGAPFEHNGFGNRSNDAKNLQVGFFTEYLKPAIHDSPRTPE